MTQNRKKTRDVKTDGNEYSLCSSLYFFRNLILPHDQPTRHDHVATNNPFVSTLLAVFSFFLHSGTCIQSGVRAVIIHLRPRDCAFVSFFCFMYWTCTMCGRPLPLTGTCDRAHTSLHANRDEKRLHMTRHVQEQDGHLDWQAWDAQAYSSLSYDAIDGVK